MDIFDYTPGTAPMILSIPHAGTALAQGMEERLTDKAHTLPDTDWHVDTLYQFAKSQKLHIVKANYSRFVIDLNRDPSDQSLYPGQFTTRLCPITLFDGSMIYKPDCAPTNKEIQERRKTYWQPYHDKLSELINRLMFEHGKVLLFDAHSIAPVVPKLFDGVLPDLNLGTHDGRACSLGLQDALEHICENSPYSYSVNGRFKGGYITRHYGNPLHNIQAVQLELAQSNYMDVSHPYTYDEVKAKRLQKTLEQLVGTCLNYIAA